MDDAAACPVCGLSPRVGYTYPHGVRHHFLECEKCHQDLQTEGYFRLADAVRAWNELTTWLEADAAHQQEEPEEAAYCERWAQSLDDSGDHASAMRWRKLAAEERRLAA